VGDSPLGPFKKYKDNPILKGDGKRVFGAGHHCVVTRPDGQMVIVYHTHSSGSSIHPRHVSMDLMRFIDTPDGPILECDGPSR
jgi:beta-xylosidase